MGTTFGGCINLEAAVTHDGTITIDTQWRDFAVRPSRIVMRLRTERDRRPSGIHLDGRRVQLLPGDVIELPVKARGHHHVVVSTD